MHSSQWTYATAADLAQALRAGKASAVELARDAIERIESADAALNAMCAKTYEIALIEAAQAGVQLARGERGPLLGVPMTIKESFNLAGAPTTWGYPEARDYRPAEDALIVSRVKAAGAVILGKTNVPLGLDDWQTYNPIYGVTNNPYDLRRTPGGSSGGSAAALAAGFGPLSLGSDIGGSLRVPAHFCGIFAHKPTLNLVPMRGQTPPFLPALPYSDDLAVVGPMTRTAGDLIALFDAIAGPDELVDGVGYRLALPPPRATALAGFRVLRSLSTPSRLLTSPSPQRSTRWRPGSRKPAPRSRAPAPCFPISMRRREPICACWLQRSPRSCRKNFSLDSPRRRMPSRPSILPVRVLLPSACAARLRVSAA